MLTTASITLNDKTGMSRYGKTNGPIARRRQPTKPGAERLQTEWVLRHYSPHSVRPVSGWPTRSIPEAMLEAASLFRQHARLNCWVPSQGTLAPHAGILGNGGTVQLLQGRDQNSAGR